MFLVKGKFSLATYLNSIDMKEKSIVKISTGDIWHFILLGQLVFLLCTETSIAINNHHNSPSIGSSFNTVKSSCQSNPHGNVNISIPSPWLESPAGICSILSWRKVLGIHNNSQSIVAINCSELNDAINELLIVSTAFDEFSSAVASFDCNQRYSVKKNCSQCLVSMITSNLPTAPPPELKLLIFL